jgi:hypothetical protein
MVGKEVSITRIPNIKASMSLLLVGLLVAGGAGTVLIASANPFAVNDNAAVDASQHHNLTVQVGAIVEGKAIPIIGAEVSVWSVSVNRTNDSVTITFTRVAHAITPTGGNVTFNLTAGNYILVANYSGLQSIKRIALDSDLNLVLFLHNIQQGEFAGICGHDHDGDDEGQGHCGNHHDD